MRLCQVRSSAAAVAIQRVGRNGSVSSRMTQYNGSHTSVVGLTWAVCTCTNVTFNLIHISSLAPPRGYICRFTQEPTLQILLLSSLIQCVSIYTYRQRKNIPMLAIGDMTDYSRRVGVRLVTPTLKGAVALRPILNVSTTRTKSTVVNLSIRLRCIPIHLGSPTHLRKAHASTDSSCDCSYSFAARSPFK